MKFLVVFVALFAVALAAPTEKEVSIVRNVLVVNPDSYNYNVETSDGAQKEEQGQLINEGTKEEGIAVTGSFSYVGDDGVIYTVQYIADENGFQPQGAHLPVAPQA